MPTAHSKGQAARRRLIWGALLAGIMSVGASSVALSQSTAAVAIRVAGTDANNSATPFYAALRQGYFKDAGLNVTYQTMGGGDTAMAAALKAGELDVVIGSVAEYMANIAKGVISGKIVAEIADNSYVILGRDEITDVKQLKGKVFGVSSINAGDYLYALAVLNHYGISGDDVTWLPLGVAPARLGGLLTGKVDGIEMVVTSMPESAKHLIIVSADDSPTPFVSNGIFASDRVIRSNRAALQRFVAALGKGADWVRAHPDDAVAACKDSGASEDSCKTTIQVGISSKNPYTWSSTSRLNIDGIKAMMPSVIAVAPKAKDMAIDDFIDTTVANPSP